MRFFFWNLYTNLEKYTCHSVCYHCAAEKQVLVWKCVSENCGSFHMWFFSAKTLFFVGRCSAHLAIMKLLISTRQCQKQNLAKMASWQGGDLLLNGSYTNCIVLKPELWQKSPQTVRPLGINQKYDHKVTCHIN